MSIKNKTGQGDTTPNNIALFTDRYEFTRQFAEYLHEQRDKILYFYGDGGNGKTWLLEHLRSNCCKQFLPERWRQLQTQQDVDIANKIKSTPANWKVKLIPSAFVGF